MTTALQLRRSFARDFAPLCALESAIRLLDGRHAAWPKATLRDHAEDRTSYFVLAEACDQLAGYMIYRPHAHRIDLVRIAVHPTWRRRSVAGHLLARLLVAAAEGEYSRIAALVPEPCLPAQMFLRENGFRCVNRWPDARLLFTCSRRS